MAERRYDLLDALNSKIIKTRLSSFVTNKGTTPKSGQLLVCTDIVNKSVTFEVKYATRIMHGNKQFINLIEAVDFYNGL